MRGIEVVYQLEEGEILGEPLPARDNRRAILAYEATEGGAGVQPLGHIGIACPAHDGLDIADEVLGLLQETRRRNQLLRLGLHGGCT